MPSRAYFAELTAAVLRDADEVKGFLQKQSPEERQAFAERMHERIIETFTKTPGARTRTRRQTVGLAGEGRESQTGRAGSGRRSNPGAG
jgi:hypothetical protein